MASDDECICIEVPMISRYGPREWGATCPKHGNGQLMRGFSGCECREVDFFNLDITGCPKHDHAGDSDG